MTQILQNRIEKRKLAENLYEQGIRAIVENEGNIGKMVIIDVNTGDYAFDTTGIEAARSLRAKNPHARLFGIRIGYNVADSLGGVMERTTR